MRFAYLSVRVSKQYPNWAERVSYKSSLSSSTTCGTTDADFSTTPSRRRSTYGGAHMELFGQVVGAAIMIFTLADVQTMLYARVGRGRVKWLGAGFISLVITQVARAAF